MNRLKRIASYTKGSKVVCDIGCDHAYTLVYAIQEYGVEKGIASDIAVGPLKNAKKTIEQYHLEDKIQLVLSNGFEKIEDHFDTAILSGMGGILICEILEKSIQKVHTQKLIIEANSDAYRVREYLFSQNFHITEEDAFYDHNKYYEIMVFTSGNQEYTQEDIQYGPILLKRKPDAFLKQYQKKRNLLISILPHIQDEEEKMTKKKIIQELEHILKD